MTDWEPSACSARSIRQSARRSRRGAGTSLRSTRVRLFAGSQVRYEWFALTAAFSFDLLAPSDLDESLPSDLPRQWRVDVGAGVSY